MVKKAIITAAGYGTRFLPATKNVPKELLPIINKPTIHYIVENCIEAGIEDIIIVTRFGNHAVEDYFDATPALEKYLIDNGKVEEAEKIKKIYSSANFIFVRQDTTLPYGNAAPLYSARKLVANEPFVYCWGDDIVLGEGAGVKETVEGFNLSDASATLFTTEVDKSMVSKLGMVVFRKDTNIVEHVVEKPKADEIVSNMCSVSNFVFKPEILDLINPANNKGREFMIQPAIDLLCKQGKVSGVVTKGKWFTTGDPLNYLKATIEVALMREDLNQGFRDYCAKRLQS